MRNANLWLCALVALVLALPAPAQDTGTVTASVRIDRTDLPWLDPGDRFGTAVTAMGDINGDGLVEIAVGAPGDDSGGFDRGAVWFLSLASDGSVAWFQRITYPTVAISDYDGFGSSVAAIGDLDYDGVGDLAVGAPGDDTGRTDGGAVWILLMNPNGTAREALKLDNYFVEAGAQLGWSVAGLGDINFDGIPDIAAGAPGTDAGGTDRGAVWVFNLRRDGSLLGRLEQSAQQSGMTGLFDDGDRYGSSIAATGDLNANNYRDMIVGAAGDDDGGADRGALWVVKMWANGAINAISKISEIENGFGPGLDDGDALGSAIGLPGDVDGDGNLELAVGAPGDDGGGDRGAIWIAFLDSIETVVAKQKLSDSEGGFLEPLADGDGLGTAVCGVSDVDGDGRSEIAVGLPHDAGCGTDCGAIYLLSLDRRPAVCGDGVHDPAEECDDGTLNADYRACRDDCTRAICGDGTRWAPIEECDDGPANSDTTPDACRLDCSAPFCGDGILDPGNDEDCDDGAANSDTLPGACRTDCTFVPETTVFELENPLQPEYADWRQVIGTSDITWGVAAQDYEGWAIYDEGTTAGSTLYYERTPDAGQIAAATQNGWSLRARVRVVDAGDSPDRSISVEYRNGTTRYVMAFGSDGAGNPTVVLWDGAGESPASGVQYTASGNGYHFYQMSYDPAAGSVSLEVDDVEVLDGYQGVVSAGAPRVMWGSDSPSTTGRAHYGYIAWSVFTVCGNGELDSGEACDDADFDDGDGCTAGCLVEPGWDCADSYGTTFCDETCGDGLIVGVEECEDGNLLAGYGCGPTCQLEGDGSVLDADRLDTALFNDNLYGNSENFGMQVAAVGDVDGDGIVDLAATTRGHRATVQPGNTVVYEWHLGAVWILFMNADRTVREATKLFDDEGGMGDLDPSDTFGESLAPLGDVNGDGIPDLAAGAYGDDDAGSNRGALYILFLDTDGTVKRYTKIREGAAGFDDPTVDVEQFGRRVAYLGDPDGDGLLDLAVIGWPPMDSTNVGAGFIYILHIDHTGIVRGYDRIDHAGSAIVTGDQLPVTTFGRDVVNVGDVDGDGFPELAVGLDESVPGLPDAAVWIYFLAPDFSVSSIARINAAEGGFVPDYRDTPYDFFAFTVGAVGDVDGDGVPDISVGAAGANVQAHDDGTVWILFLNPDGSVKSQRTINYREGGLDIPIVDGYLFGYSVAGLPDTDGDGVSELAVGAIYDSEVGFRQGAIWVLHPIGTAAFCGNGVLDPGEECDDGPPAAGDGCATSCVVEDFVDLAGTASGGEVSLEINGTRVTVPSAPGQSGESLAAALASTLASHPQLLTAGIEVTAVGARVTTSGVVTGFDTEDFGITNCPSASVPTVTTPGTNTCPSTTAPLSAGGFELYQWYREGIPLPGAVGPSLEAQLDGIYRVRTTDDAGCQRFSAGVPVTLGFCSTSEVSPAGALFPLVVERDTGSASGYTLRFQEVGGAVRYHLYAGTLGTFYSHGAGAATTCDLPVEDLGDGELRADLPLQSGSTYYLVAASDGTEQGPSGFGSGAVEIDPAQSSCAP